jgi:hypothetical protein
VFRNTKVLTASKKYVGIWHARLLRIDVESGWTSARGDGGTQLPSVGLVVGEDATDGFTSQMQVQWNEQCVAIWCNAICMILFLRVWSSARDCKQCREGSLA